MSSTRWSKFFWSDWRADTRLNACSLAAQGLWMHMLCIAAEHDPPGYVALDDEPLTPAGLADLIPRMDEATAATLVAELEHKGVFSRDRHGCIYNRRMISDYKKAKKARKNGALGGNPTLTADRGISASVNLAVKAGVNRGVKPRAGIQSPKSTRTESRVVESSSITAHATASTVPNGHDPEPTRRHGTAPNLDSDLQEGAGPGTGAALEASLRQAAGIEHVAAPWPADLRPIYGLIGDGYDLDRDILPALRGMVGRADRARSWGYFERAIREHAPAKTGPPERAALPPLSDAAKAALAAKVFVIWDTPAWDAWQRHYRSHNLIMPSPISRQHDHKNGWYFPTEWPPETAGKEQAA